MIDFDKVASKDVEVIRTFIKHFNLPEPPEVLNKAMDALEANETKETKEVFTRELLDYLATYPGADLSLLDKDVFEPVQKAVVELNDELKGDK